LHANHDAISGLLSSSFGTSMRVGSALVRPSCGELNRQKDIPYYAGCGRIVVEARLGLKRADDR